MQSTGFAGRTFTLEEEPLSAARSEMAESFALVDDANLADRVLAPESGTTPNLTDQLLDLLPAAVYLCAPDGRSPASTDEPLSYGAASPCLAIRETGSAAPIALYRPDGASLPHDKCPMADILRDGIPVIDQEVVIERADGSRGVALVNIRPLKDAAGNIAAFMTSPSASTSTRNTCSHGVRWKN